MDYIISIFKKIAVFYIISNLFLNLVNDEKYKKYIRLYVGIVTIVLLIKPVGNILNQEKDFSTLLKLNTAKINSLELRNNMGFSKILDEYETIVRQDVSRYIEENQMYLIDIKLRIETDEEADNFGYITDMDLIVSKNKNGVSIAPDIIDNEYLTINNPQIINIKKYISNVYKINESNINVNIVI